MSALPISRPDVTIVGYAPHTGFDPCDGHDPHVASSPSDPLAPCAYAPLDDMIQAVRAGYYTHHDQRVDLADAIKLFVTANQRLAEHNQEHDFAITPELDGLEAAELEARTLLRSAAIHNGVDLDALGRAW